MTPDERTAVPASDRWRSAAVYQVYVRSFADGDGDGTGDLAGVRARLPYLVDLGVDALCLTPAYASPFPDDDPAGPRTDELRTPDPRTVDPALGTLAEVEKLIVEARDAGLRTLVAGAPDPTALAFLSCPWEADRLRSAIDDALAAHAPIDAPATWVLATHEVTRTVTRYGRADTAFDPATETFGTPTDLSRGTRRARAAALLTLALPGSVHLYQGEELGLPEAEVPRDRIRDPAHLRSGGRAPGRDGCRVPLPWSAEPWRDPWLPQPAGWDRYAADRQALDPGSVLSLYREALRLRRASGAFGGGGAAWLPAPAGVLAFRRPDGLVCAVNLGWRPVPPPAHTRLLLSSGPLAGDGLLPQDTAVWLRT
ncbi:alpha-amylase family glycosyl hydrolase [Streptomyces sp. NPDC097619]|uniref:alpha-amylase family glycosyl hydrolase n=1 Tax=Streptomyces sp. NPDC097619 TaxID=3157228 RepID=UPI003322EF58